MKRRKSRGTSLVLTAFAMFALLATAALAIDWGLVYLARHQLQNFVDAAALAGAQELPGAAQAKQAAAENYARNYGENFRIPPPTPQTISCPPSDPDLQPTTTCYRVGDDLVHITTPYQRTGDPSPNPNLINVKACRVVSLFFARVLGVRQIRVCAKATAIGSRPAVAHGLIVLDPSAMQALWVQGTLMAPDTRLDVRNGSVYVNSSHQWAVYVRGRGGYLTADKIYIFGGYYLGPVGAYIIPTPLTGQPPTTDPLASLPPPSTSGLPTFPGQNIIGNPFRDPPRVTLQPGIYTGPIRVGVGAIVTLQPGIYILRGGLYVWGHSEVRGNGVLLYNENGPISVINAKLILSSPTSGTYKGIAIFQPSSNGSGLAFQAWGSGWLYDTLQLNGTIYAPRALVHFYDKAVGRIRGMLIARLVKIERHSQVTIDTEEPPSAGGEVAIGLVE
ncbi:MAG: hypothetical protein DFNUSKGM_002427 [Candidatus Fervidibacter sacchari]